MKLENEISQSVFVPDILTAAQYYDSMRRDSSDIPLKRLMMAVLQDAIRCLQKGADLKSGSKRRHLCEVQEWVFGESGEGPFAFQSVCEILDIAPQYLRRGLDEWLRRRTQGSPELDLGRRNPVLGSGRISSAPERPRERRRRARSVSEK
jgi:hypothetical protein